PGRATAAGGPVVRAARAGAAGARRGTARGSSGPGGLRRGVRAARDLLRRAAALRRRPAPAGGGGTIRSRGRRPGGVLRAVRATAGRADSALVPDYCPLGLRASPRGFGHFLSSSSTI